MRLKECLCTWTTLATFWKVVSSAASAGASWAWAGIEVERDDWCDSYATNRSVTIMSLAILWLGLSVNVLKVTKNFAHSTIRRNDLHSSNPSTNFSDELRNSLIVNSSPFKQLLDSESRTQYSSFNYVLTTSTLSRYHVPDWEYCTITTKCSRHASHPKFFYSP